MSQPASEYYRATRHPWSCVLFVLPLLIAYEVGVATCPAGEAQALRNGADTWLHWGLGHVGLRQSFWPGALLAAGLLGWAWWGRADPPAELPNVWMGMVLESAGFALLLLGISRALGPLLDGMGVELSAGGGIHPAVAQLVSFLGAGIYEEVLFRLILFSLFFRLFQIGDISGSPALVLAVGASALIFATAHHAGPAGEEFDGFVFLFRAVAGVYFSALYRLRGLGVAVGTHAGYDILVGVVLPAAW